VADVGAPRGWRAGVVALAVEAALLDARDGGRQHRAAAGLVLRALAEDGADPEAGTLFRWAYRRVRRQSRLLRLRQRGLPSPA
jgi:hypothetical protein